MASVQPTVAPGRAWFGLLKSALAVALNPGGLLKSELQNYPWPWTLGVSGFAFVLFFLQTGLDLHRAGQATPSKVLLLAFLGAVFGSVGVGLISTLAWLLSYPFGKKLPLGWAVRAFGLAYSPALIYGIMGLFANLVWGWNTAVAFGVTGFLWALGPMLVTVSEMTENRLTLSYVIATLCGGLLLLGWGSLALG